MRRARASAPSEAAREAAMRLLSSQLDFLSAADTRRAILGGTAGGGENALGSATAGVRAATADAAAPVALRELRRAGRQHVVDVPRGALVSRGALGLVPPAPTELRSETPADAFCASAWPRLFRFRA